MDELFDLAGKTALVTGGARGVGLICSQALVDHGAFVLMTTRRGDDLPPEAERLVAGGSCQLFVADLAGPDGPADLARGVGQGLDRLDILVNNAGATWGATFEEYPAAAWTRVLHLNVAVPFILVQALLPLLEAAAEERRPARVVNIGSIDGHAVGLFDNWAYPPSKAGLHHLTRVLACRLGPSGITVNALAPGVTRTKMTGRLIEGSGAAIVGATPLGRLADSKDIAGALVFLTSRAGEFLTGSVLALDGGASLAQWGGNAP
jgi:NAD(P)-dependent dehydrogenase (short-subunit alcohol dehydrogenase family)